MPSGYMCVKFFFASFTRFSSPPTIGACSWEGLGEKNSVHALLCNHQCFYPSPPMRQRSTLSFSDMTLVINGAKRGAFHQPSSGIYPSFPLHASAPTSLFPCSTLQPASDQGRRKCVSQQSAPRSRADNLPPSSHATRIQMSIPASTETEACVARTAMVQLLHSAAFTRTSQDVRISLHNGDVLRGAGTLHTASSWSSSADTLPVRRRTVFEGFVSPPRGFPKGASEYRSVF